MEPIEPGSVINEWTVLSFAGRRENYAKEWLCKCTCGRERVVQQCDLKKGKTRSCGCKRGDALRLLSFKHGEAIKGARSPEYVTWSTMKNRCLNQNHPDWVGYGGRGIGVCDRWRDSFESFLADMGRRPSRAHSIERVDNNGGYEPGNCKWASPEEQAKNRSPRGSGCWVGWRGNRASHK